MAERRMFAKTIIDSDAFLDMPLSTQALYFHLSMRADDDGFINNPKKIQRMIGCLDDDLKLLIAKKFIIPFESGIVVIKHWKIHNYIRNDRYKETIYKEEKAMLNIDENNGYTVGIPNGYQMDTQDRLGKDSIGKDSIDNISSLPCNNDCVSNQQTNIEEETTKNVKPSKHKYGEYQHVQLTDEQYEKLQSEYSNANELITYLDEYIELKGYKAKNHYLAIKKWVVEAVSNKTKTTSKKTVERVQPVYNKEQQTSVNKDEIFKSIKESLSRM